MDIDPEKEAREIDEELDEDAERLSVSPYWRYGLAIILAVLFISYLIVSPRVHDVIAGFFESSSVDSGYFNYGNKTIVFQGNTYDELVELYRDNQEHEFKSCLKGRVEGNNYIVSEVMQPEVHSAHVYRVVSDPCPVGTIIDLHSHPYQRCIASQTDLDSLERIKKDNPKMLLAVMCTEERISFYG